MHVALSGEASAREASGRGKREKKPAKIAPGTIVTAKVTNVHATHAGVELESGAAPSPLPYTYFRVLLFVEYRPQGDKCACYACWRRA